MSLQALERFRVVGRWVRVQIKPLAWVIRPWVRLFGEGQHLVAGHLAYTTVLALPAFLIFILAAAKLLGQQGAILHLMEVMLAATPAGVEQPVRNAISDMLARPALGFFTLGLASSLWISSGLLDALRQGLNRAYGVSAPGSYWRLRVQAVGMTVLFGGLLIVLGILLLYLPLAQQAVTASVGIEIKGLIALKSWRQILLFSLIVAVSLMAHRFLPQRHPTLPWLLPGIVTSTALWLGLLYAFAENFQGLGRIGEIYGALAGGVALLLFFYLSALIFLYGAYLNAEIATVNSRRRESASGKPLAANQGSNEKR